MPSAVVLLSGGLDSTTVLAIARERGFTCHALTVRYGQLHAVELAAAARVAAALGAAEHRVIEIDLASLAASALTRPQIAVPKDRTLDEIGAPGDVPSTYVPARNTVLLSLALAWAESIGARDLFLGVNVLDASGYPDCRPEFVRAFEALAGVATRAGGFRVHAPLIELTKAQIIQLGRSLGVDYGLTHSCYEPITPDPSDPVEAAAITSDPSDPVEAAAITSDPSDPVEAASTSTQGETAGAFACGRCDACQLRRKGFAEAGVPDPTRYAQAPGQSA